MKTTISELKRVVREALVTGNGGVEKCPYCDHEFGTDQGSYHPPGRVQCPECGGDFDAEHDGNAGDGEPDECEGCGVGGPLEFVETPDAVGPNGEPVTGAGDWVCPTCAARLEQAHGASNAGSGGGDYESFRDLKVDHPEAAEQWLDTVAGGSESDSWWENEDGSLWGMAGRQAHEWVPDRGWEPRRS